MRNIILGCCISILLSGCFEQKKPKELSLSLFDNKENISKFIYSFDIEGKGDVVIDKTKFGNLFTLERQKKNNLNSTYLITPDTTIIFSPEFKPDGNAASIFPIIGLTANIVIDNNGKLKEVLNEEEIIKEYEKRLDFMSSNKRMIQLQKMKDGGIDVFLESLFTLNYKFLFSDLNQSLQLQEKNTSDSFISATPTSPKSNIKRIKEVKFEDNHFHISTQTLTTSELFRIEEGADNYTEILPFHTNQTYKIIADSTGLITNIELNINSKTGGANRHSTKSDHIEPIMIETTEYRNVKYKRLKY